MTYDVALTNNNGVIRVAIPMAIGRVLLERGYTRAVLEVSDAGLVIKPYTGEPPSKVVDLPDWQ